MSHAIVIMIY